MIAIGKNRTAFYGTTGIEVQATGHYPIKFNVYQFWFISSANWSPHKAECTAFRLSNAEYSRKSPNISGPEAVQMFAQISETRLCI